MSADVLPEPTFCDLDEDGECNAVLYHTVPSECSCRDFCGEGADAGCCYCAHADIYAPCPRGGFWCFPTCGGTDDDACCTPEQRAFAEAAYVRLALAARPGGEQT